MTIPDVIPYARGEKGRWGPIVFWPSRISLVLLGLSVLAGIYLRRNHDPWRLIRSCARAEAASTAWVPFSPPAPPADYFVLATGGRLVVLDASKNLTIRDARTGTIEHDLGASLGPFPTVEGGPHPTGLLDADRTHVLFRPSDAKHVVRLINVLTGQCDRSIELPETSAEILDFSQDEQCVIAERKKSDNASKPWEWPTQVWRRTGQDAYTMRIATFLHKGRSERWLSPKGNVLYGIWYGYDTESCRGYLTDTLTETAWPRGIGFFYPPNIFALNGEDEISESQFDDLMSWSAATDSLRWQLNRPQIYHNLTVSPDTRSIAATHGNGPWELAVIDAASGHARATRGDISTAMRPSFFLDGRRLLAPGPALKSLAVYDAKSLMLVASFEVSGDVHEMDVADGQFLTATVGTDQQRTLLVFEHVGRESRFGVLGMPPCWLLVASVITLFASLCRDARRMAGCSSPMHAFGKTIRHALFCMSAVLTTHTLVAACIGHLRYIELGVAAAYLLCTLGLFMQAKLWQLATLLFSAASLPFLIVLLRREFPNLIHPRMATCTLLDRAYTLPSSVSAMLLLCGILLALLTLVDNARQMARRL